MKKEDFEILKDRVESLDNQNEHMEENDDQNDYIKNEESKNRRKSLCNENREEILKLMKFCLKNRPLNKDVYENSLSDLREIVGLYKIIKEEG